MSLLVEPLQSFIPASVLVPQPVQAHTDRRLVDAYGRRIGDLRISVTDRCNFRCVYCMPEEGMQWLKRESILSFDEIERVARVAVYLGVEEIRLTRGEPTLRPNLTYLLERLSPLPARILT